MAVADVLSLDDPENPDIIEKGKRCVFWHPAADYRHFYHEAGGGAEPLLKLRLENGNPRGQRPALAEIRARTAEALESLDSSHKRLLYPHIYKVSITSRLRDLKLELIKSHLGDL